MKTTIDIDDELLRQAKKLGNETARPLRSVVEEGLRNVLQDNQQRPRYRLPDLGVGSGNSPDPLEKYSWPELRDVIYGGDDLR